MYGQRSRDKVQECRYLGEVISSIPMFTRFLSPPDTPRIIWSPTLESATLPRPSSSIT